MKEGERPTHRTNTIRARMFTHMLRSLFCLYSILVGAWFFVAFVRDGPDGAKGVLAFLLLGAAVCIGYAWQRYREHLPGALLHPNAPAWFQAIAAAMAIVFAVAYPEYRQSLIDEDLDTKSRVELMGKIDAARRLIGEISYSLGMAVERSGSKAPQGVSAVRIDDWLARLRHLEEKLPRATTAVILEARIATEPFFLLSQDPTAYPLSIEQAREIQRQLALLQARLHDQIEDVSTGRSPMTAQQRAYWRQVDKWVADGLYLGTPAPPKKPLLRRPGDENGYY